MNNSKMIALFSGELEANELKAFRYKLSKEPTRLKGILHSNHIELSLSLLNQNELEIESLDHVLTDALTVAPTKRMLNWEQDVKHCAYISGTIRNLSPQKNTTNLYLLLDK